MGSPEPYPMTSEETSQSLPEDEIQSSLARFTLAANALESLRTEISVLGDDLGGRFELSVLEPDRLGCDQPIPF